MTLTQTYLTEKGHLRVPRSVYEEIGFSLEKDKLFLSEEKDCIIISKECKKLPVCNVHAFSDFIEIDREYCVSRGLFNPENECVRENTIYKPNENGETAQCVLLSSEYKIQYYIKDSALVIPLPSEQLKEKYYYYTSLKNGIIHLPSFILSTIKIRHNMVLKAEVKNGGIYCRKCRRTDSITYHQTITPYTADIAFKEQFLPVVYEEIAPESFLLKAAHIQSDGIARLRLTKKTEFVIERL